MNKCASKKSRGNIFFRQNLPYLQLKDRQSFLTVGVFKKPLWITIASTQKFTLEIPALRKLLGLK